MHTLTLTCFAVEGRIKDVLNLKLMLKCFVESGSVITIQPLLNSVSLFLCSRVDRAMYYLITSEPLNIGIRLTYR